MDENIIENKLDSKKIIYIIVGALVIISLVVYAFKLVPQKTKVADEQIKEVKTVQPITKEDALAVFPQGFPVEKDASNSVLPQISYENGRRIIAYNYSSSKIVAEIAKSFQNFFTENNWKYETVQDTTKLKVIYATNIVSKNSILITINNNETSKKAEVSLLYTEILPKVNKTNIFNSFPTEKGVGIEAKDEQSINSTGLLFFTRNYISKLSLDENYNIYLNYLSSSGWSVAKTKPDSTVGRVIIATKPNSGIKINIAKAFTPEEVQITIILTSSK